MVKAQTQRSGSKKAELLRQCALSKHQLPTDELIRFVLSPEQIVTPDLRRKLPGRGLWLSADRLTITQALKKNIFARGFRQKVVASDDLADNILTLVRKEALASLSLANKAGLVITGYEKIKRGLVKGDITWLLHAFEASHNGSDKLDRFFTPLTRICDEPIEQMEPREQKLTGEILPSLFTGDELNLALGRPNVIHIGLKPGEMAHRFAFGIQKIKAFEHTDRPASEKTSA